MTDCSPEAAGGRPWVDPRLRPVLAALLGAVGVEFWLVGADGLWGRVGQVRAVASVFVVSLILVGIPPLRNGLTAALERLRWPSRTSRRVIAVGVALVSMGYLFWTARHQGRAFAPAVKDEYCYLIQARQIAAGRLWMPRHAVADAFDTFYMISDPVYASKYFPGTAVAIAAALKVGLPPWSASLALSGAAVGLLYLLLTELLDGWAGLLGSVLLLSMQMFRRLSVAYMSQPLLLVLALGAVLAYLRWRGDARAGRSGWGWMALIGACVGGAVVTRPLDAVCVAAAPLAVAILVDLRSLGLRRAVASVVVAAVAGAPLAALQLACNRGITGRWLETPWTFYARHDDPYDALGWRAVTPDVHTRSVLPQKRLAEEQFTIPAHRQRLEVPFFRLFLHKRLQYLMDDVLPWAPLVALIPVGVLALVRRPGRAVLWAGLPLLALGYTFHTVYLSHYAVAAAPATIFAVLAGAWAIVGAMPGERGAGAAGVALSAVLLTAAVTAFPEVTGERTDEFETAQELRAIDRATAGLADAPSIVLFRFGPGANPLTEPVYNAGVAWPDDARVIRAHDLGDAADARLMAYYAARDPGRRVYRYDRSASVTGERLRYLGTVGELAKGLRGGVKR